MTHLQPVDEEFVADLRARGTAPSDDSVTSLQLCVQSGLSYRQCDYFVRTGRLVPSVPARGSGSERRFTRSEAKVATIMRRLLAAGLALSQSHDTARAHVADPDELIILGPGLALIITDEDDDEPAQAGAR